MSWIHYTKGARVGEWTSVTFDSREEAVAYARARVGVETTVIELGVHSTMPHERVTVFADGRERSERVTVCG